MQLHWRWGDAAVTCRGGRHTAAHTLRDDVLELAAARARTQSTQRFCARYAPRRSSSAKIYNSMMMLLFMLSVADAAAGIRRRRQRRCWESIRALRTLRVDKSCCGSAGPGPTCTPHCNLHHMFSCVQGWPHFIETLTLYSAHSKNDK